MGRPRLFDEEAAVDAACRVFWTKGYDATTTGDLCEATGLGRSSVYNTFESKSSLFYRALRHYTDTTTARQTEVLEEQGADALTRVRRLLGTIIDSELAMRQQGYGSGCFAVNTITSLAPKDVRIADILERDLERRLLSLRTVVAEGRRDGSISSRHDPSGSAWYLASTIYGLRVSAQFGASEPILREIAEAGIAALA